MIQHVRGVSDRVGRVGERVEGRPVALQKPPHTPLGSHASCTSRQTHMCIQVKNYGFQIYPYTASDCAIGMHLKS